MTKLKKFNIVFASDLNKGISRAGKTPWTSEEDANYFRSLTTGRGKNVVIVGRNTYERVFAERPLSKRTTFVISRTYNQEKHPGIHVFPSLKDALTAAAYGQYDEVFIGGGCSLYQEVTSRWMYLCENIFWTQFKIDYKCDTQFPEFILEGLPQGKDPVKTQTLIRHHLKPNYFHREIELLEVLERLISEEGGPLTEKRLFGVLFEFSLLETFPFLTTNQVDTSLIFKFFLFALSGKSHVSYLRDMGLKTIYADETSTKAHEDREDGFEDGDMGPWWGWFLRHWGTYVGHDTEYECLDQFSEILENLRLHRKGFIFLRDPSQEKFSSVESRYNSIEFIATYDHAYVDSVINIASTEVITELKNDIAIFSLLLLVISTLLGARARNIKFMVNELWTPHKQLVEKQIQRTPLPFPLVSIRNQSRVRKATDLDLSSFIIKFQETWSVLSPIGDIGAKK
jgi:dihydrofolate reductase/thymidylate synthase